MIKQTNLNLEINEYNLPCMSDTVEQDLNLSLSLIKLVKKKEIFIILP